MLFQIRAFIIILYYDVLCTEQGTILKPNYPTEVKAVPILVQVHIVLVSTHI